MDLAHFRNIPLGAKPDRQDRRDVYKSDKIKKFGAPPPLPKAFHLPWTPPIKDQGQTSSCTGHSATEFFEQIMVSRGQSYIRLSPMFSWYYGRLEENSQNQDTGIQMRTIMDSLHTYGVVPEAMYPFGVNIYTEPPANVKAYAAMKLPSYSRCDDFQAIKYSLAIEKQSVCIGMSVYDTWYDSRVSQTGIIPYKAGQQSLGGHAVLIVGYDDDAQLWTIQNSWGLNYGKGGIFQYPYQYLMDDWWDAWTAEFDSLPKATQ